MNTSVQKVTSLTILAGSLTTAAISENETIQLAGIIVAGIVAVVSLFKSK